MKHFTRVTGSLVVALITLPACSSDSGTHGSVGKLNGTETGGSAGVHDGGSTGGSGSGGTGAAGGGGVATGGTAGLLTGGTGAIDTGGSAGALTGGTGGTVGNDAGCAPAPVNHGIGGCAGFAPVCFPARADVTETVALNQPAVGMDGGFSYAYGDTCDSLEPAQRHAFAFDLYLASQSGSQSHDIGVWAGADSCREYELGQLWFQDYDPPASDTWTSQCFELTGDEAKLARQRSRAAAGRPGDEPASGRLLRLRARTQALDHLRHPGRERRPRRRQRLLVSTAAGEHGCW